VKIYNKQTLSFFSDFSEKNALGDFKKAKIDSSMSLNTCLEDKIIFSGHTHPTAVHIRFICK